MYTQMNLSIDTKCWPAERIVMKKEQFGELILASEDTLYLPFARFFAYGPKSSLARGTMNVSPSSSRKSTTDLESRRCPGKSTAYVP